MNQVPDHHVVVSWRIGVLAVLLGGVADAGCRTTTENPATSETTSTAPDTATGTTTAPLAPIGPPTPPPPPECPPAEVVCGTVLDPVHCAAGEYRGRPLPASLVLVTWADNACLGRLALAREACRRELLPSALGRVQCVPDTSAGNCPPLSVACPAADQMPTACLAGAYGDQVLTGEQALRAWGGGACRATAALREQACRRNLDPRKLGRIVCAPDKTVGDCPPKDTLCDDPLIPAKCAVTRWRSGLSPQPLEASGNSACEAKQALARLACSGDMRPSDFDEVVCRFEK